MVHLTPLAYAGLIGTPASANLMIGRIGAVVAWYFDGSIDDVRIYNRGLSSNEVSELDRMNATSSVVTTGALSGTP